MNADQTRVLAANLAAIAEVERVRQIGQELGVRLLYLKGAAFLDTLYEDVAARPMVDVDLLVRPNQRQAAGNILRQLGFERLRVSPHRPVTEDENYEWLYRRQTPFPLLIELHSALCQRARYTVDYQGLWDRAVCHETPHRVVPTLAAEDSLLHVALHQSMHAFIIDRRSSEDIRRIIVRWRPNWQTVVERARRWQLATTLYVSLVTAKRHCGAPVPHWVLTQLRPSALRLGLLRTVLDLDGSGRSRFSQRTRLPQLLTLATTLDRPTQLGRFIGAYAWLRLRDWYARG